MAIFNDKKPTAPEEHSDTQSARFSFAGTAFLIFVFGSCLSCILSTALVAGRFTEFRIPLFLMEFPATTTVIISAGLLLSVFAGLILQKNPLVEESPKGILSRAQKISYFFSVLATLGFTAYLCAVLVHLIKTQSFLSECLYLVILYAGVLAVHFKAGKSSLAHMFTTAAFILIMIVTAFYGGIASAKVAHGNVTMVNGEMYSLVGAQRSNYILVGFEPRHAKSNGRILILPQQSPQLENIVFYPYSDKR